MQEQPHKPSTFIRLSVSLILLGLAAVVFLNRQLVIDRVVVWQYKPSAAMQSIVAKSHMTPEGKFYFYASQPEINERADFNENCTSSGEKTVVLGCYAMQRIYIFDINDARLEGIKEVTAAHEMLHAVYDRLSFSEKERVNGLIETQLKSVTDKRILGLIVVYDKTEPGERLNELHSIFATELMNLSAELETYYSQYFKNRASVVALSQQYEQVFSSLNQQQNALVAELNILGNKITVDTQQYNADAEQLSKDVADFNARANNNGYSTQAAFEADRDALVIRQNSLASMRAAIASDIETYNVKRKELEAINGQAAQLNQSIDSNALEPTPSI